MYDTPDRRPRDEDEAYSYYGFRRRDGRSRLESYEHDNILVRCRRCTHVGWAAVDRVWDDEVGYDEIELMCEQCGADGVDKIPGRGPCERCDCAPVTRDDTDYCDTCDIALELDDEIGSRRLQRAWDAIHAPMPPLADLIRDITMSQAGAR